MQASPSTVLLSHFHIDYNLDSPRLVATVHQNVDKRAEENKSPASLSFIYVSVQISLLSVCLCLRVVLQLFAFVSANVLYGWLCYKNRNPPVMSTGMVPIPQPEESKEEADGCEGGHGSANCVRCRAE